MSRFLRTWGPAIVWAGLLFAASSQPTLPVDLHSNLDKLAHFGAYAVLGLLLARAQVSTRVHVLWAVGIGAVIGGLDEFYQGFVPGRATELGDWIADALGVVAGVACYHLWRQWLAARSASAPRRTTEPLPHE